MSLKKFLCEEIIEVKKSCGYSYLDLMEDGKLQRSQVRAILKCDGEGVSIDKILSAMELIGFHVQISARFDPEMRYLSGGGSGVGMQLVVKLDEED